MTTATLERAHHECDQRLPRHDDSSEWSQLMGASLLMAGALMLSPNAAPLAAAAQPPAHLTAFRDCVAQRESHSNPRAVGDESSARGKYQFLKAWQHGLPYMVRDRLVRFGMKFHEADRIRKDLQAKTIDKWSEALQDVAFAEVVETPRGTRHWWIAGSRCNKLGGMR